MAARINRAIVNAILTISPKRNVAADNEPANQTRSHRLSANSVLGRATAAPPASNDIALFAPPSHHATPVNANTIAHCNPTAAQTTSPKMDPGRRA